MATTNQSQRGWSIGRIVVIILLLVAIVLALILRPWTWGDDAKRAVTPENAAAEHGTVVVNVKDRSKKSGPFTVILDTAGEKNDLRKVVAEGKAARFTKVKPGNYFLVVDRGNQSTKPREFYVESGETHEFKPVYKTRGNRVLADPMTGRESEDLVEAVPAVQQYYREAGRSVENVDLVRCRATKTVDTASPNGSKKFFQGKVYAGQRGWCAFDHGNVPQGNRFDSKDLVGFIPDKCTNIGKPAKRSVPPAPVATPVANPTPAPTAPKPTPTTPKPPTTPPTTPTKGENPHGPPHSPKNPSTQPPQANNPAHVAPTPGAPPRGTTEKVVQTQAGEKPGGMDPTPYGTPSPTPQGPAGQSTEPDGTVVSGPPPQGVSNPVKTEGSQPPTTANTGDPGKP